ncbi:Cmx/CmrA family chloramphenicol efflux MFS transporter [Streptomyces sp. SID8379]|uniref:Cmx/CmrA family chloramphenicol efflux MFS transporter n=1 Tax=unclassified Streptomyces TaxID=2593676 RepID=UPI0003714B0C|nr:Cmx/CmrA family chloramphenicol efflux MFS transporter [Streptomyces sp. HmicA12]MYW68495.1 Cmx/CmrA family chloramphenicol efflux MFS transporter [Streptomyces sp. SID8379]
MPFVLPLLALAVFAQGTSEFMLSGLVPDIAHDLGVSVPAAGSLTSAFALGMIVGAPATALLARRRPRREALCGTLLVFLLAHVVGALTSAYGVLLATRVVAALANAGFLAVALATAASLAAPDAKGRATSILLGGTTLACVAGVPGGALLGQLLGWRVAFWAVAALCLPALVAVVRWVPAADDALDEGTAPGNVRDEARALRSPRLLTVLVLGALVNAATFCTFTYLASLATDVTGIDPGRVPVLLALFGLGSFAGVMAAGRWSDARPTPVLVGGGAALLAGWVLFAYAADSVPATLLLAFAQGALSFAVGSTLIARALYAASGAPNLAGGCATAALNVGAALGPWAGGLVIDGGLGYRAVAGVSAVLVAAAFVVGGAGATARAARRRTASRPGA